VFGAATAGCTSAPKSSQDMRPTIDYAESLEGGKKNKNRSEGGVCLLTKGVLISVRRGIWQELRVSFLSRCLAPYGFLATITSRVVSSRITWTSWNPASNNSVRYSSSVRSRAPGSQMASMYRSAAVVNMGAE
jgi:hypothetical protein